MTLTVSVSGFEGVSGFGGGGGGYSYNGDPRFGSGTSSGCVSTITYGSLAESARKITAKPDHEFNPILDSDERPYYEGEGKSRRLFCQDCPPGCIWMDDPAAHLYVIREWELG